MKLTLGNTDAKSKEERKGEQLEAVSFLSRELFVRLCFQCSHTTGHGGTLFFFSEFTHAVVVSSDKQIK